MNCLPRQIASCLQCKHLYLNDLNKLKYIVSNTVSFESFLHTFSALRCLLIHSFIMMFSLIDLIYLYFKSMCINNVSNLITSIKGSLWVMNPFFKN